MGIAVYTSAPCSVEEGNVSIAPNRKELSDWLRVCSVNLVASYSAFSRNRQTFAVE